MKYSNRASSSPGVRVARPKGIAQAWWLMALLQIATTMAACAQTTAGASAVVQGRWVADKATHLIGLPDAKPEQTGVLTLSPTELTFTTEAGATAIARDRVLSLSVGDERMERGGTMGRVARTAIPFGGGQALAAMSGAQVDLLTVEFRDRRNAYHGAVFVLPKGEAIRAQREFLFGPQVQPAPAAVAACVAGAATPRTVQVERIAARGEPVPREYEVLLYEQLMRRLHEQTGLQGTYRDGDTTEAAACAGLRLTITVDAFKKGNATLRAATGPLGMFVGTTQLKLEMVLRDDEGTVLLDKQWSVSQRGDRESLGIADAIAKSVAKRLKKANAHRPVVA